MIIRLLHGQVPRGQESRLIERLRGLDESGQPLPGFGSVAFGFRRGPAGLEFIALSTWESMEAVSLATAGAPDAAMPTQAPGRSLSEYSIDLYEAADEGLLPTNPEARALGLVWGRVTQHSEPMAHEMIRATAANLGSAGVIGLHVGRRVVDSQAEILVVASWRDRLALHTFAQGRSAGTLDPEFLRLMTDWRFETYDCLAADSQVLPDAGGCVLLVDPEGLILDASAGTEAVLGVPAELVLRTRLNDLIAPDSGRWSMTVEPALGDREIELTRPGGGSVSVWLRSQMNYPQPGVATVVLSPSDAPADPRSIIEIVAAELPTSVGADAA